MSRETFDRPTNPYHYALHCLGGKWKMTILHEIYTNGFIHFNQTLKVIPVSEKVLSQQLKELISDGLVIRKVNSDGFPPSTEYALTDEARDLIPALDILYIWSIRHMDARNIPIDADAFVVHSSENYVKELRSIMEANGFFDGQQRSPKR
ncbi:MAG: helix-turn-helix transcriptional regulator [Oscillospiraceae bacterium]|nr:helix-turn-helix transcriptional regulator [Oscillospiraceae bacterium]